MCSGSKGKPSETCFRMEGEYGKQERKNHNFSPLLLEYAASDDLKGFKYAVEQEGFDINEVGLWYGRRIGSRKLGLEKRTPLMIAAMFGSKDVLAYILETGHVDVNQTHGSDGATTLHCAVVGGSDTSPEVVKLLLDASADVDAVDANGKRPCDLIAAVANDVFSSRKRMLQAMLKVTDAIVESCFISEEEAGQMEQQQQHMTTPRVSKDGTEKKDYPVDLSLPDIKNGIYGIDEFRMYTFKVKPCSRAYSHDWTECPFVHPGENARRRDPRKYHYSCVPCPEFKKGSCSKGDACDYAHGIFECWLHPAQYRTRLCKDEGACTRRVCFFAHKPEELRPLYASTGSAMSSPRSFSPSASSLEMGSITPLTLGSPSVLTSPTSPPSVTSPRTSSPGFGTMWPAQSSGAVPTLQLPRSRLKTSLAARDLGLDIELLGLENHRLRQQLMMDEMPELSSQSGWNNAISDNSPFPVSLVDHTRELNRLGGMKPSNLEDYFGSPDPSIYSKLLGISLDSAGSQLKSPTGIDVCHNGSQQLWKYSSGFSSGMGSTSFGAEPSGTAATMAFNSRIATISKRSQSFTECSAFNHHSELSSPSASAAMKPSPFSDWGSPDGKLDWAIHGEELNKLRKSASFGFRSSNTPLKTAAATMLPNTSEPDVTWVHSLVKDAPSLESGQFSVEEQQQKLQYHHDNGTDAIPAWLEHLYKEQEQVVA